MSKKAPFIDLQAVLNRVAALTGARTDSAIAAELDVSPQTLSTWKNRRKIPFEQLCEFAQKRDIFLDHLLLGKTTVNAGIDLALFKEVQQALKAEYSEFRSLGPDDHAYYAAHFYNHVVPIEDHEVRRRTLHSSVVLASQSALRQRLQDVEESPVLAKLPNRKEHLQSWRESINKRLGELESLRGNSSGQPAEDSTQKSVEKKDSATHIEAAVKIVRKSRTRKKK